MKKITHPVIPAKAGIYINIFRRIFFGFFSLTTCYLLLTTPTYAADCVTPEGVKIGNCFGFGNITSLGQATSSLVMPIFSLAAVAVIIYFLFGALKYLKAGGNKEEVAGARQTMIHSIVGFIILMFAFLILQFLLSSLFKVTDYQLIK